MEKEKTDHAAEAIRAIDAVLAEETTLQDGLEWARSHGFLTEDECTEVLRLFHQRDLDTPTAP